MYSGAALPYFFGIKRFKEQSSLKALGILIWVPTMTFLPFAYGGGDIIRALAISMMPVFMVFIGGTVFDMRDIEGDEKAGIMTIPVRYGAKKTRRFLYLVAALFALYVFIVNYIGIFPPIGYMLLFNPLYSFVYLYAFNEKIRKNSVYYMLVDCEYALMAIVLSIGKCLIG